MSESEIPTAKITRSRVLNAANASYSSLTKKVLSSLVMRSVLLFLALVLSSYLLLFKVHSSILEISPAQLFGYFLGFCFVYFTAELFLSAYILRNQVILPLKDFVEAAQNLASGKAKINIHQGRTSEFINLNEAFHYIKQELNEKDKRIAKHQKSLEKMIDERTSELKQALEHSQSTTQAKIEFFANITHDIKTPMNGIIGLTDLVLDSELNEEQRNYLELIKDSGDNLVGLINDILDFSKIEAGKMTLHPENVELRKVITRSLTILNVKADQKGITIVTHIEDTVPQYVIADGLRLKQLLQNFISNSIKFTNSCGAIIVRVAAIEDSGDSIKLQFSVSDTGIGIPASRQEAIFESFQQGDDSTESNYGGTGLGLSICKQIIGLMAGKIWVDSKPGIGTAFHFTINVRRGEAPGRPANEIEPPQPADNSAYSGEHILVCEDNIINTKLVVALLRKRGLAVTAVENGIKAIEELKKTPFSLVLMDCQMPQMDGFETTRLIRRGGEVIDPKVPVIALTANTNQEDRERCQASGMNAFISKPFNRDEFFKLIDAYLKRPNTN